MFRVAKYRLHPFRLCMTAALALVVLMGLGGFTMAPAAQDASAQISSDNGCKLQGNTKHVIYVQFDNTHFTRDNPNVPSDLEFMPNLLNFLKQDGTLLTNHHTPLIAHTATDILTSFTGVYGDHHGVPISNSFRYFNPDGTSNPGVSFAYWTDPIFDPSTTTPTDTSYNMLSAPNTNAPAPWVPYTRAGCNFGGVATANMVLENIGTDIPTVFGANSPEAQEVAANPAKATADFVGIGIHCAQNSAVCANNSRPDLLPSEPGGYTGYQGLFGSKYVTSQISPNGPLVNLDGQVIQDSKGNPGFPGFDSMTPSNSLAYVASMQEHGVPITYAYLSDAHDNHSSVTAFGPGESGYVAALQSYDQAFGKFFTRLAADGINKSNTLFVFTADEGDHFSGSAPTPANCNGVTIPCTYSHIGELNANMAGLLATQQGVTTPFKVHSDSAPNVYITGNPARTDPVTRDFERATGKITAANPLTGNTDQITNYMADPVEMNLLHMVTADPARTPTFTMFAKPDYFLFAGAQNCNSPCVTEPPAFAWNHGDVSPDINTTWLGMVGPGVRNLGTTGSVWSDHTDIRPTMLELLGLKDDYRHDGRVLFEILKDSALPSAVRHNRGFLTALGQVLKQLNAPVGDLGLTTLNISTSALESGSTADDSTYAQLESDLQNITVTRNVLVNQILSILESAEFGGSSVHSASINGQSNSLVTKSHDLLTRAHKLHQK